MKVEYYPDTDSLYMKLIPGVEAEGVEVAPGIVFHYTPDGKVTAIDIDSEASKSIDLSVLSVGGIPLGGEEARHIREEERNRITRSMEHKRERLQSKKADDFYRAVMSELGLWSEDPDEPPPSQEARLEREGL